MNEHAHPLIRAIENDDMAGFKAAVDSGADVNMEEGLPLRRAAKKKNFLMLRELMLAGADIRHALEKLQRESERQAEQQADDYFKARGGYSAGRYSFAPDFRGERATRQTIETLVDYQETFLKAVLPVETARTQMKTLRELRALRREITEYLGPAVAGKPDRSTALQSRLPGAKA